MARPKATVKTERLCVTIPADELKAAKKTAFVAGVTWADFVRQALLLQAAVERGRPVAGEGGRNRGEDAAARKAPSPTRPEPCAHKWASKGWGSICSACGEVKR
jgi:hypothetical protein